MKKNIVKIIVLTLIYVSVSIAIYFILDACGLTSVSKIRDSISRLGVWGYVLFFLFQIVVSTFICVIPFEDEVLTTLALVMFGSIKGCCIASFNMFITSSLQFLLGRKVAKKALIKIVGEDSIRKYEKALNIKGEIILPVLYLVPLLPHDSLCILAGTTKMKYWYFAPVTLIMRSLEIVSICFLGSGLIDFSAFVIIDWIIVVNLVIIDLFLLYKLEKYLEFKINNKYNQEDGITKK